MTSCPERPRIASARSGARAAALLGTLIPLIFLQGGCVEAERTGGAGFTEATRLDSSGVLIVESDGGWARSNTVAVVDPVPEIVIGAPESSDEILLHRVEGIAVLEDGSVLVVESGSRRLMTFGRDGGLRSDIGRDGDGPGEFRSLRLVPPATRDSVMVFDRGRGRYTVVSLGSGDVRGFTAQHGSGLPVGVVGGRVLLARLQAPFTTRRPGPYRATITYKLWTPGQATVDTVVMLEAGRNFVSLDLGEFPAHIPIPFDVDPSATTNGEHFFLVPGPAAEIHQYDRGGRLRRILRLREHELIVTDAVLEAAIEDRARRWARDAGSVPHLRRLYQQMPIGTTVPSFDAVAAGPGHFVWARVFRDDDRAPEEWMAFDENGAALGSVAMPIGFELHQATSDFVFGRWTDSLGVEQVRGHRLRW